MAKLDCHYFPGTPALWRCTRCSTLFGEKCIPAGHSSHWGRRKPACPRCNSELDYLGSATGAKPFWQMLPHFFVYPLHPNSLLVLGLVVAFSLFFSLNLVTVFLALFAMAVVMKYCFAIIEQRGSGNTVPPQLGAVVAGDEHHLFLRQIAVFVGMGLAAGIAAHVHDLLGLAVLVFIALAIPASTVILAVEKSVRRALDPAALLSMMTAIGWPYLLLWFFTQLISAAPTLSMSLFAGALPVALIVPVMVALMVYFTFVLYAMLGYVLFEYQSELGFESVADKELDEQSFEKARALGETAVLLQDGEPTRARQVLRGALDSVPDDLELHFQYHKLLMQLDDDAALVNHCDYIINLLKQNKSLNQGTAIVLDVQKRIPGFKLADTESALELANLLQLQGQHRAAVQLFHNLHKTRPQDPLLPEAYLLVANTLFEHFGEDAKALAMAKFVLAKYPNNAQRPQFEKLVTVLDRQPLKSAEV